MSVSSKLVGAAAARALVTTVTNSPKSVRTSRKDECDLSKNDICYCKACQAAGNAFLAAHVRHLIFGPDVTAFLNTRDAKGEPRAHQLAFGHRHYLILVYASTSISERQRVEIGFHHTLLLSPKSTKHQLVVAKNLGATLDPSQQHLTFGDKILVNVDNIFYLLAHHDVLAQLQQLQQPATPPAPEPINQMSLALATQIRAVLKCEGLDTQQPQLTSAGKKRRPEDSTAHESSMPTKRPRLDASSSLTSPVRIPSRFCTSDSLQGTWSTRGR